MFNPAKSLHLSSLKSITSSLQMKLLLTLSVVTLLVVGLVLYVTMSSQQSSILSQLKRSGDLLGGSVFNGIIYPLSRGDNETVKNQLAQMQEKMKSIQVFVFDFDQKVSFATEKAKIDQPLSNFVTNPRGLELVKKLLKDGANQDTGFEEKVDGRPFFSVVQSIRNEPACYHCHGQSHPVLGGLLVRQSSEQVVSALNRTRLFGLLFGGLGILGIIVLVFFLLNRFVVQPIRVVAQKAEQLAQGDLSTGGQDLRTSEDEVGQLNRSFSEMTGQLRRVIQKVMHISRQVADGSSTQASAFEETSASINEIASMTKKNAENARFANRLMIENTSLVEQADQSMQDLEQSMKHISEAGLEIGKIIKTIDGIAFQTNLLALNAAVEAARAGEAGAGFAVVANEVRSLALKSTEASKNTADLIKGTLSRIEEGSGLVNKTGELFDRILAGTQKAKNVINEISEASHEQSQGLDQVNQAIVQIEGVTQKNAEGAEEMATDMAFFRLESGNTKLLPAPED
jgi:methyl-accepting chemotaxis protein